MLDQRPWRIEPREVCVLASAILDILSLSVSLIGRQQRHPACRMSKYSYAAAGGDSNDLHAFRIVQVVTGCTRRLLPQYSSTSA